MNTIFATKKEIKIKNQKLIFDNTTTELQYVDIGQYKDNSGFNGLFKTKITDVVFTVAQPNLQYLDLSYQPIKKLVLKNCPNLQKLYLYNCGLEELVFEGNFPKLEMIDVSKNNLTKITLAKNNFPALQNFFISGNPIKDIGFLSPFILQDNYFDFGIAECRKIINPPKAILEQGNEAIIDFFRSVKVDNKELKIILLGNSTAGKTSLVQYLTEKTYPPTKTTHGISNTIWKPKDNDFIATIWDFGGQEYYHATHRLFLTDNAMYLLLWDKNNNRTAIINTVIKTAEGKEEIKGLQHFHYLYWLKLIRKKFAPKGSIITIQNKIDKNNTINIDQTTKDKFNIKNEFQISIEDAHNNKNKKIYNRFEEDLIDEIKEFIKTQAPEGEEAGKIPRYIDSIRQAIRGKWNENYIDFKEFKKRAIAVSENNGDPLSEKQLEISIKYLHKTGILLYYGYNNLLEGSLLKKYVFLQSNYVTQTIYKILDEDVIAKNNGKFDYNHVKSKLISENEVKLFIDLMRSPNFELIFKFGDYFYASQFLPKESMVINKVKKNVAFAFALRFPNYFSPGFITRFISRYGINAKTDAFTRTEIVVEMAGVDFYISADIEKETINIYTSEKGKEERFIRKIYDVFIEIADGEDNIELAVEKDTFIPLKHIENYDIKKANLERVFKPLSYEINIKGNFIKVEGNGNIILQDVKGETINLNIYNFSDIKKKLSDEHKEILALLSELKSKIIDKEQFIDFKETVTLYFTKIYADRQKILKEFNSQAQKIQENTIKEITRFLTMAFEANIEVLSDEMKAAFEKLNETDDLSVKAEIAVPLLKFLTLGTVDIKAEIDVKSVAEKLNGEAHKWYCKWFC